MARLGMLPLVGAMEGLVPWPGQAVAWDMARASPRLDASSCRE